MARFNRYCINDISFIRQKYFGLNVKQRTGTQNIFKVFNDYSGQLTIMFK